MTMHLPHRDAAYPKPEAATPRANAWGSQWKHLPRSPRMLVRNAMRDALRMVRAR